MSDDINSGVESIPFFILTAFDGSLGAAAAAVAAAAAAAVAAVCSDCSAVILLLMMIRRTAECGLHFLSV